MKIKTSFLKIPFIPENPVSHCLIDGRFKVVLRDAFLKMNITPIWVEPCLEVYDAIACHPDIQCHPLSENKIIIAPNANESLKSILAKEGFNIWEGKSILAKDYPYNISYNVARIDKFAFHNTKYTDPVLKEALAVEKVELIHVNQGYTKCSISVLNKNSIITQDISIAKKARDVGIDVFLLNVGHVKLFDFKFGFFGGATGLIGKDRLGIAGNLSLNPQYNELVDFFEKQDIKFISLAEEDIYDVGSIIPIKTHEN